MTVRSSSPNEQLDSGRAAGRALLIAVLVLSLAATAVLVLSDSARWLRLGVVSALWSALVGAFLAAKYRRQAVGREDEASELQSIYELELEREVAARREYELEIEADTRRRVEEETSEHLEALRTELHALRENLEALLGGEVLVERVALRAESTRMRSLPDQSRVISVGDDRMAGADERPRLPAGAAQPEQRPPQPGRQPEFTERFGYEPPSRPKEQPRAEPTRREAVRPEPSRPEPGRREAPRTEPGRREAPRTEPGRRAEPNRMPPRQQPAARTGYRAPPQQPPAARRAPAEGQRTWGDGPRWPAESPPEPRQDRFTGGLAAQNGREPVQPNANERTGVVGPGRGAQPPAAGAPGRHGAEQQRADWQQRQERPEGRPPAETRPAAGGVAPGRRPEEPGRHGVDRDTTGVRSTAPSMPAPAGGRRRAEDDVPARPSVGGQGQGPRVSPRKTWGDQEPPPQPPQQQPAP